ncbi:MAG TPA: NAD(P)-dependent oxidoreductase [Gammaproteobacteria bacterium]
MPASSQSKPRVCVYVPIDQSGESHRLIEAAGCEVVLGDTSWRTGIDRDSLLARARGADALMGATIKRAPLGSAVLERLPDLRIISKYTIGVEDVDLDAATEMGVLVTNCPTEANWGGVAEGTMALILALLKRIRERDRHVKDGGWRDSGLMGTYLGARQDGYPGITVGIVGLGRIGSRVADLLAPWRVRLLATDPYVDSSRFVHHNAAPAELEELLRQSDVVTLHCNLTVETRGLIGESQLALMKPSAILVNTARGPIVDVEALREALDSSKLAGAALDVLPEEPPGHGDELLGLGDRILLSPHMVSANVPGTLNAAIPWATDATLSALRGIVPKHVCNQEAIPRWLERFGGNPLI